MSLLVEIYKQNINENEVGNDPLDTGLIKSEFNKKFPGVKVKREDDVIWVTHPDLKGLRSDTPLSVTYSKPRKQYDAMLFVKSTEGGGSHETWEDEDLGSLVSKIKETHSSFNKIKEAPDRVKVFAVKDAATGEFLSSNIEVPMTGQIATFHDATHANDLANKIATKFGGTVFNSEQEAIDAFKKIRGSTKSTYRFLSVTPLVLSPN